jgi:Sir2 family
MRLAHFSWRFALSSTALVYAWLPSKQEYDRSASNNHDANFKSTTRFYGSDGDKSGDFSGETLETLAEKLGNQKFQNIVVLIGAGASVSAGIPDFRTAGTGLYDRLQHYQLPYPEAIFDLDYYQNQPKPFVELCQEIWPGKEGTRA